MRTFHVLALSLLLTCSASAANPPAAASPDLDWLAGQWCLESGDKLIEEHWLPAKGGLMLGLSRTTRGDRTLSFEFLRVLHADGATHYLAQPQGAPPTSFRLTASGTGWARFENPAHDFPQRIEYRRTREGLHAEIATGQRVIPFHYLPCAGKP